MAKQDQMVADLKSGQTAQAKMAARQDKMAAMYKSSIKTGICTELGWSVLHWGETKTPSVVGKRVETPMTKEKVKMPVVDSLDPMVMLEVRRNPVMDSIDLVETR